MSELLALHTPQSFPSPLLPCFTPPPQAKQWLTRILYMAHSPFALTLALDSQVVVCTTKLSEWLSIQSALPSRQAKDASRVGSIQQRGGYDVAYNTNFESAKPHCWALLYRHTPATRILLQNWFLRQVERDATGEDQTTLHEVAMRLAARGKLRLARLSSDLVAAAAKATRGAGTSALHIARSTQLLQGHVWLFHLAVKSEASRRLVCAKLNGAAGRRRVLIEPRGKRLHEQVARGEYEAAYSLAEYERLVGSARQIRPPNELMWNCERGRRLPLVYPFKEHTACDMDRSWYTRVEDEAVTRSTSPASSPKL